MNERKEFFYKILKKFDEKEILDKIILIGSWCQYLYSIYFDTSKFSSLRTSDIGFLIPKHLRCLPNVNVHNILIESGFDIIRSSGSHSNHYEKFFILL